MHQLVAAKQLHICGQAQPERLHLSMSAAIRSLAADALHSALAGGSQQAPTIQR